ncbi:MAG: Bug family tripartite tricarboxylate transporter substrate binding protein [Hyphomicrobiaceae bacterium]
MKRTLVVATAAIAASVSLLAAPANATPSCSTAKLIVPWKAGGGTQVLFAIFEQAIQKLDVPVKLQLVMIPGQGGNKGAKEAAKAKPDGCTLFAIHQSAITSYLQGRIPFQFNNFETVSLLTSTPDIIGANGKLPFNTFADLKKAVQAEPGKYTVGATFGSTSQFLWLLLEERTGMKFKYVPYDGTRQRMTALLSGAINLGSLNVASGRKYLESGELKGFGIVDTKRSSFLPDMPTMKEQGVDLVFSLQRGVVAPKGTPKENVDYWADVFKQAAADANLLKQMKAKGTDIKWVGPADYRKWADATFADYKKVAVKIGMYKGN